jgi:hypothetical protein
MKALTDLQRTLLWCVLGLALVLLAAWRITARVDDAIEAARTAGHTAGQLEERATWQGLEDERAAAAQLVLEQHEADLEAERKRNIETNLKVSHDHENEIDALRAARAADRAAFDRAGGLRIPAPATAACAGAPGDRPGAGAEAPGTSGRDDPGAATIRLPQQVENDLWSIVDDADEVSSQLRACQGWIRTNGFYGPKPTDSRQLLDRMIAAPNQPAEEPQ